MPKSQSTDVFFVRRTYVLNNLVRLLKQTNVLTLIQKLKFTLAVSIKKLSIEYFIRKVNL